MDALERILRFRRLTEQQARRDLERATQLLRAAVAARERQVTTVEQQRAALARCWQREESRRPQSGMESTGPEWALEEAALEFSGWTRLQLEELCAAEARKIEPLVEQFHECRRALRQTERLIEQRAALERAEEERGMQAEADEWFLQQTLRRSSPEQSGDCSGS